MSRGALLALLLAALAVLARGLALDRPPGRIESIALPLATAGAFLVALAPVLRRRLPSVPLAALGALVLAAGLAAHHGARSAAEVRPPAGWAPGEERSGWLLGRVTREPLPARGGTRFGLRVERATIPLPSGTSLSLWADSTAGVPRLGARLFLLAALHAPAPPRTPGGFDERRWLAGEDAALSGRVRARALREVEPPPPGLRRVLVELRTRWSERLAARVPGECGEFLRALLLGERKRVAPETVDAMRRAGVLHLLALSGQHVALVAALLAALARLAGAGRRGEAIGLALGVAAYAILTGASPSVVRAGLGAVLGALAASLGRRRSGFETLAWSAALGALASPRLGGALGFQLSCLASAGIVAVLGAERALRLALERAGVAPRPGLDVAIAALRLPAITASAQLAVLPLLAGTFGAISAVGLASNLVVVPLAAGALTFGLPLLVLDTLVPTPAIAWRGLSAVAALALTAGERFAAGPGARLPCALPDAAAAAALAALAVAVVAGLVARRLSSTKPAAAGVWTGLAAAAAGLWLGLALAGFHPRPPPAPARLQYWLLDVGQGDAQVLEWHDGRVWVVDTGDARPGFDAGARVLVPFLRARGHTSVDLVILTHEDRDHAGGFPALARELRVDAVASGAETLGALARRGLLDGFSGRRRVLARDDTLVSGPGGLARVLWPPSGRTALAANARSVTLLVECGRARLLLPGDADSTHDAWAAAVAPPVDLLKLAHHGARSSSAALDLERWRPAEAVVSCGRDNRFGHPHRETRERLGGLGIPLARTDLAGSLRRAFGSLSGRSSRGPPSPAPRP